MNVRQMVAAGVGGVLATAADVATLVVLVHRAAPIALAAFLGCTVGAAVNFTANKYLAFRDRSPVSWQQVGRFALVAVATALLLAALMELAVVGLGVPYLAGKLVCSALVFLAWTYPAQRRLVFAEARSSS